MDAEDYLNDEDRFNVTNRLVLLFPKIDRDPTDGFVTEQADREVMHRTQREMDTHDKNKDGFVSFAEYDPPSWVQNADNSSFGYDMGWWKEEHFNASDADGDSLLNLTEFNNFMHPADTKNPKLLHWLCKEEVRYLSDVELLPVIGKLQPSERYYAKQQADYIISQADGDKDGRLTLTEMIDYPYVIYSAIFNEDNEDDEYHDEFR